jgi:hypothetical protein
LIPIRVQCTENNLIKKLLNRKGRKGREGIQGFEQLNLFTKWVRWNDLLKHRFTLRTFASFAVKVLA